MDGKRKSYHGLLMTGVLWIAILSACISPRGSLPTADQLIPDEPAVETMEKEVLQRGRALAVTECAACHRFFYPREYPPEQWDEIIRNHGSRATLDKAETADLRLYIIAASKSQKEDRLK